MERGRGGKGKGKGGGDHLLYFPPPLASASNTTLAKDNRICCEHVNHVFLIVGFLPTQLYNNTHGWVFHSVYMSVVLFLTIEHSPP